jgi:hypothetical protein
MTAFPLQTLEDLAFIAALQVMLEVADENDVPRNTGMDARYSLLLRGQKDHPPTISCARAPMR